METYISELLYRYDCVIIPEFGAFLTKRISAQIDSEHNLFIPPRKELSFNAQLQHNDGLLCNHIAEVEKIPYADAISKIQACVLVYKTTLNQSKKLEFNNIGSLTVSDTGSIGFNPSQDINYLTSSFGLSEFESKSIDRIKHKELVESVEKAAPITLTKESKEKRNWLGYAAAAIIILGLSGFGGVKYYENRVDEHNILAQEEANKQIETKVQEATFVIPTPLPNATLELEKQTGMFHIVAGAFRIESNSSKKVKQLKSLGYRARKIGVNRYGLHEVVYSSYQTRTEAQQALAEIRANHNSEAWLLIKKID